MRTLVSLVGISSLLHVLQVDCQPHPACNTEACSLPDCFCPTHRIPADLDVHETPQTILFSFNGPVTSKHAEYVKELFNRKKRNPNGTPIRATFFISDKPEKTDYCMVNGLWAYGHEMGSSGVNRRTPEWWATASQEDWDREIEAQKEYIVSLSSIDAGEIRGFRSPHLQTGGNAQYEFASEREYVYDSSIILPALCNTSDDGLCPRLWPYTMDYPIDPTAYPCHTEPCPDGKFPGLWQIPIQPLLDRDNHSCIYLDKCPNAPPRNAEEVEMMLMRNFRLRFEDNRAPLLINLYDYEKWFREYPWALQGVNQFINTVLSVQDDHTWIITYNDLIGWMEDPRTLRLIRWFAPFDRIRQDTKDCEKGSVSGLDGQRTVIVGIVMCAVAFLSITCM